MYKNVANKLKDLVSFLSSPDGDIKKKFYTEPEIKPPRRNPSILNKTNAPGYMQEYMKDYRGEGKDYQKLPDKIKHYRRQLRKKLKEQIKERRPLQSALIDQELTFWKNKGQPIDPKEFEFICSRRGFNEEEQKILAEELLDLNLIID
jgi:hypothetical protein